MKNPLTRDDSTRFRGGLRHYHRSGSAPPRTWDEWVDGKSGKSKPSKNWVKIVLSILGLLALGGVIAGLIVELR